MQNISVCVNHHMKPVKSTWLNFSKRFRGEKLLFSHICFLTSSFRRSSRRVGGIPGCLAFSSSIKLCVAWSLYILKIERMKKIHRLGGTRGYFPLTKHGAGLYLNRKREQGYTCRESVLSRSLCSSDDLSTSLYISAASTNSPTRDMRTHRTGRFLNRPIWTE